MENLPSTWVHELGPSMRVLTELQQNFVQALYHGAENPTQAVRMAGYATESEGYVRWMAHHLMHNPKVREAIIEEGNAMLTAEAPIALRRVKDIARDVGHKDGLKANLALLQRSPFAEVIKVEHKKVASDAEEKAEALAAARRLGVPLDKFGIVEDVEYTDITPVELDPEIPL
jgi:hypothetical protein